MKKHTPGPYLAIKFYHEIAIQQNKPLPAGDRPEIAVLSLKSIALSPEEQDANALLFAAAPEMLEALELNKRMMANLMAKGNVDWGNTFGIDFALMNEALLKMDASIAKAKGGE